MVQGTNPSLGIMFGGALHAYAVMTKQVEITLDDMLWSGAIAIPMTALYRKAV